MESRSTESPSLFALTAMVVGAMAVCVSGNQSNTES
jgi:hypothetical protein